MENETRLELDYIKKAIDELKLSLQQFFEREEERSRRLAALEQFKAISEIQALSCQREQKEDIDRIWIEMRKLESKGKNNLQSAAIWISMAVGVSSLLMWVIKLIDK